MNKIIIARLTYQLQLFKHNYKNTLAELKIKLMPIFLPDLKNKINLKKFILYTKIYRISEIVS